MAVDATHHRSPFPWMRVGHWTDAKAKTGCTIVRFTGEVVASGEVRGGAPATREFSLLEPTRLVEAIHAVCLSGGSAFGLAVGDGVARSLRVQEIGFETPSGRVPIVIGLSLYDLDVGDAMRWPGPPEGEAALDAVALDFEGGLVGAGTGATVGKWRGPDAVKPGGMGFAVAQRSDVIVASLLAVNAVGDIITGDSPTKAIVDGTFEWPEVESPLAQNTTIGVIATNANLTKTQCRSVAEAGHDGLARALVPAHGPSDGDALVAVAHPEVDADLATVRLLAASSVEMAIASLHV